MTTQPPAQPGTTSHDGAAVRPFRPRSWNARTRVRFITRQQRHWLSRCPSTPSERQVALAQSIAQLAWAIALAEHAGDIGAMRDLREHVRLKDRLIADFERSLASAAKPRVPTLAEVLAADTRRRAAEEASRRGRAA